MIIDLLTNNSNNESLAFGCSGFAADLYFVDSGVNGPDITDNEISILMTQQQFVSESLVSNITCYIIVCNGPFADLGYRFVIVFNPPLYLITVL